MGEKECVFAFSLTYSWSCVVYEPGDFNSRHIFISEIAYFILATLACLLWALCFIFIRDLPYIFHLKKSGIEWQTSFHIFLGKSNNNITKSLRQEKPCIIYYFHSQKNYFSKLKVNSKSCHSFLIKKLKDSNMLKFQTILRQSFSIFFCFVTHPAP